MQSYRFISILLASAVLFLGACSKKKKPDPLKIKQSDVAAAATDISLEQAKRFGADFSGALNGKDFTAFSRLLDEEGMFYRIFPKATVDANRELKGAKKGWSASIGRQLFTNMSQHRIEILQCFKDSKGTNVRFRLLGDGLNYLDVLLSRDRMGKVSLVDYLEYVSGGTLSENQRLLFQQLMPGVLSGNSTRTSAKQEMANLMNLQKLGRLFQTGDHEGYLAEYSRVGPRMQSQRTIMHMRVMAASTVALKRIDEGKDTQGVYTKAVDEYRTAFPGASNMELILIDYHFMKKEFKEVIAVVDKLDKRVGGDPYLDLMRGNSYFMMGDNKRAMELLRKAEIACPWDGDVYNSQLEICIEEKDHAGVTRVLIAMEKNTDTVMDPTFNGAEAFENYRASDEFPKWQAYVKQRDE